MNLRNLAITSVIILGLLAAYAAVSQGGAMNGAVGGPGAAGRPETITYSQLVQRTQAGDIREATIRGDQVTGVYRKYASMFDDVELGADELRAGAAELAEGYREQLHLMGAAGTRDVLEAAGLTDPLDHDLLDHIWESIVEAAVAWWQEHEDHTAEQMAQRLTRLLAVVTLRG